MAKILKLLLALLCVPPASSVQMGQTASLAHSDVRSAAGRGASVVVSPGSGSPGKARRFFSATEPGSGFELWILRTASATGTRLARRSSARGNCSRSPRS